MTSTLSMTTVATFSDQQSTGHASSHVHDIHKFSVKGFAAASLQMWNNLPSDDGKSATDKWLLKVLRPPGSWTSTLLYFFLFVCWMTTWPVWTDHILERTRLSSHRGARMWQTSCRTLGLMGCLECRPSC